MTSSPEIDRLFREGVAAIRAGDKAAGREKLLQVVELDEMHEQGWLWLSATVESDDDRIVCLENVLTINPDNEHAQRGLEKLTGRKTPAPPPTASAPAESPPPVPSPPPPTPAAPPPPKESMPTARIPDPPVPTASQPATSDWTEDSGEAEIESLLDTIEARIQEKSSLAKSLFEEDKPAQRSSSPSNESWQQPRAEAAPLPASARSGGASSAWAKDADAEPANRSILDLFDAWFSAMLFNAEGSFALELPVAAWDRVLVNLVFTGIIAAMGGILQALLISTLGGGSLESFVLEQYPELFDLLSEASVNMSQLMGAAGIIYLVVTVVSTVLTGLFVGIGVHASSRTLGGSGEMIETLHSLTMARVAFQIVNLLPMIVTAIVPGLSDILNLAAFGYALAINVFAISYVHKEFGIWKSILTLILGGLIASIFLCIVFGCLGFALIFALGGAAG